MQDLRIYNLSHELRHEEGRLSFCWGSLLGIVLKGLQSGSLYSCSDSQAALHGFRLLEPDMKSTEPIGTALCNATKLPRCTSSGAGVKTCGLKAVLKPARMEDLSLRPSVLRRSKMSHHRRPA